MATITKKDLIDRIADSAGCKRVDVKKVVQMFLDQLIEELAHGNRLEFRDFGVLETKARAPRIAQNPKTLQRVSVPAKRTVKFKVGRLLKERLDLAAANDSQIIIQPGIGPDGKMQPRSKARHGKGEHHSNGPG